MNRGRIRELPPKKWTVFDEIRILEYFKTVIHRNESLVKPSAKIFYSNMIVELNWEEVSHLQLKSKVIQMRKKYVRAKEWLLGCNQGIQLGNVEGNLEKLCPNFKLADEVLSHLDNITVPITNINTSNDFEFSNDIEERDNNFEHEALNIKTEHLDGDSDNEVEQTNNINTNIEESVEDKEEPSVEQFNIGVRGLRTAPKIKIRKSKYLSNVMNRFYTKRTELLIERNQIEKLRMESENYFRTNQLELETKKFEFEKEVKIKEMNNKCLEMELKMKEIESNERIVQMKIDMELKLAHMKYDMKNLF